MLGETIYRPLGLDKVGVVLGSLKVNLLQVARDTGNVVEGFDLLARNVATGVPGPNLVDEGLILERVDMLAVLLLSLVGWRERLDVVLLSVLNGIGDPVGLDLRTSRTVREGSGALGTVHEEHVREIGSRDTEVGEDTIGPLLFE